LEGYVVLFALPFVLFGVVAWGRRRRASLGAIVARCLLALSLLWMLSLAVFPIETSRWFVTLSPLGGAQLVPLRTVRSMLADGLADPEWRQLAGNVALFAPFGAALPLAAHRFRRAARTIAAGALLSIGIELAQGVLPIHGPDIDDVLLKPSARPLGTRGLRCWSRSTGVREAVS
jgi:glycopeptide antibiotics resistance protein